MKELLTRLITGIIFIAALLGSILINNFLFAGLILIFSILGQLEFFKLIQSIQETREIKILKIFGIISGVVVYVCISLVSYGVLAPNFLFINLLIISLSLILLLSKNLSNPFSLAASNVFGILYVVVPLALLNYILNPTLQKNNYFPENLIGYFILMWTYDVFAYLVGSLIGKHKLSQHISPKKTWEGSIGSGIITLVVAWVVSQYFTDFLMHQWIAIAAIIVIFGTLGDIAESMLKRSANAKDSGRVLPGHGGVLDRFDGVLFSAPVVIIYISIIQ